MEWQHLRVMTCHINLIKEDSEGQEEGGKKYSFVVRSVKFLPKKDTCDSPCFSCMRVLVCVLTRITPLTDATVFPAQSGRQLLSVDWTQSTLSVTHCTHPL